MQRQFIEVARISGMGSARLRRALIEGRPIEFEFDGTGSGDDIVLKAVAYVKPQCRREFVGVTSDIT